MFQLKIDNLRDVMFTLLRFATNKGQVRVDSHSNDGKC